MPISPKIGIYGQGPTSNIWNSPKTILVYPYKTSKIEVIYYFNNILKVFVIIWTHSTWFHVNLILHLLHFAIQKFSHIKLGYPLLERKLVLIYWMMKILKYLMSSIQTQIHHLFVKFQKRLRQMCGSLLSIENILSQIKACLANSSTVRYHIENQRSIPVYTEVIANIEHIL